MRCFAPWIGVREPRSWTLGRVRPATFALKIAPRVAPGGTVFAVDLRRESLAFLWVRARLAGLSNLHVPRLRIH